MWLFFGLFYLTPFALIPIGIYFPEQNCSVALPSVYVHMHIYECVFSFLVRTSNCYWILYALCVVCCVLGCVHVCIRKSLLLAKNYRFHNILVFCSFSLYLSIYLRLPMMLPTHISTGSLKHPHHSTCKYELANIWNPEKPHAHIYI